MRFRDDMEIEDMLLHGLAFIPPVDPVQLKAAVQKLVQLANNQRKKSYYSYPKEPSSKDPVIDVESITESSRSRNRQVERLQEIEITGIDASLPSKEVEDVAAPPQRSALTSPNTFSFSNQGSQVSPATDDIRDSYVPPATTINTLGTFTSRAQGRRQRPSGRRRKVKGSHDRCPYPHTTRRRRPLVPPTLPTRPTIPELMPDSLPDSPAQPGVRNASSSNPRSPGVDSTTDGPTTSIPSSNVPNAGRFPNSHQPIPFPEYDYTDYEGKDDDDYNPIEYNDNDYEYEVGIDPGLTEEDSNTTAGRSRGDDSLETDRSLSDSDQNERPVIILVEPENGENIPGPSENLSNPFARLRKQNESPLIIVDSGRPRTGTSTSSARGSSGAKSQDQNRRPIVIVDSPPLRKENQGRSLSRSRYFGLEASRKQGRPRQTTTQAPPPFPSTPKSNIRSRQNSAVVLIDSNDTNLRDKTSSLKNLPASQQGGSVIILVDPEGNDEITSSGGKSTENGKDSSPIIIVDNRDRNADARRAGGRRRNQVSPIILVESKEKDGGPRTGRRVSEWDGEGSVIILVEPEDGSELPTPKPVDTLNPIAEPPSIQLVPPPRPQFESSLADDSKPRSRPASSTPAARRFPSNVERDEGNRGFISSPRRGSRRPLSRHRFRNFRSRDGIRGSPRFASRGRGRGSRERDGVRSRETGFGDDAQRQRGNRGFTDGQGEARGQNFGGQRDAPTGNRNLGSNSRGIFRGNREFFDDYEDDFTENRRFRGGNRDFPDDSREDPRGSREFFTSGRNVRPDGRDFITAERTRPNGGRASSEFTGRDDGNGWGGSSGFSWLSDFPAEVSLTRTQETIPEKIRELRHSIEEKARAWTQFGLQRTRPEFRRTRRPFKK